MIDLVVKFILLMIALSYIYVSIKYPLLKFRQFGEPMWFKVIAGIYILNLVAIFIVFFYIFTSYWAILSTLMIIPYAVWGLRVNNLMQIKLLPETEGIVDIYFIRYLFLSIMNERWNKVERIVNNIIKTIPEMDQNDRAWLLLIKSYSYIKSDKNEDAMDILFTVLDYEELASSYKECIRFQFYLIEKSTMVA